jgi:hypothetical protein
LKRKKTELPSLLLIFAPVNQQKPSSSPSNSLAHYPCTLLSLSSAKQTIPPSYSPKPATSKPFHFSISATYPTDTQPQHQHSLLPDSSLFPSVSFSPLASQKLSFPLSPKTNPNWPFPVSGPIDGHQHKLSVSPTSRPISFLISLNRLSCCRLPYPSQPQPLAISSSAPEVALFVNLAPDRPLPSPTTAVTISS